MDLIMKHLLSLLAISLMVSPAFADTVVEIKSVELKATKANGKAWDVKIWFPTVALIILDVARAQLALI